MFTSKKWRATDLIESLRIYRKQKKTLMLITSVYDRVSYVKTLSLFNLAQCFIVHYHISHLYLSKCCIAYVNIWFMCKL